MKNLKCALLSVSVLFASVAVAAPVGEWNYKLVPNGVAANNYANLNPAFRRAKVQLFQDGNAHTMRMQGTGVDECFTRESPTLVEKTADTTTMTPQFAMRSCPRVRFVVKNDGSGGMVMVNVGKRNAEQWADDENDYGLTRQ